MRFLELYSGPLFRISRVHHLIWSPVEFWMSLLFFPFQSFDVVELEKEIHVTADIVAASSNVQG